MKVKMKTAIFYYSYHHHNTLKLIKEMTTGYDDTDLLDITAEKNGHDLSGYDIIGFASGIYGFETHKTLTEFAENFLPEGKPVFFVYTYGLNKGAAAGKLKNVAAYKKAVVLGEYGCKGYATFGPFKMVGGIAKNHPDTDDILKSKSFFADILKKAEQFYTTT